MFKCNLCNYTTLRKYNLSLHYSNKHNNLIKTKENGCAPNVDDFAPNVDDFAPNVDSISISEEPQLNPKKNKKCSICKKEFSTTFNCKRHMMVCKGKKQTNECHLCKRVFASSSSKSHHLKVCKGLMLAAKEEDKQPTYITNNTTNNINNGTIINNTIVFQENPNNPTQFIKDNINIQMLSDIIGSCHNNCLMTNDYTMMLESFYRHICDTKENLCIKKTNKKSKYLSVKTGDDTWETKLEKAILPKLTKDVSYNFVEMINNDKFESPLLKIFKNGIISDIRHNLLEIIHKYKSDAEEDDYLDKQIAKEITVLADRLTSVIIDKTKRGQSVDKSG